jgi:hypothetical protein
MHYITIIIIKITFVIGDSEKLYEMKKLSDGSYKDYLVIERIFNIHNFISGHITSIYMDKDYGEFIYCYNHKTEKNEGVFKRLKNEYENNWKYILVSESNIKIDSLNGIGKYIKDVCYNLNAKYPSMLTILNDKQYDFFSSQGQKITNNITSYETFNVLRFVNKIYERMGCLLICFY